MPVLSMMRMNDKVCLITANAKNSTYESLSFYIQADMIAPSDIALQPDDALLMTEGLSLNELSFVKYLSRAVEVGRWIFVIPPFLMGHNELELGRVRIEFEILKEKKNRHVICAQLHRELSDGDRLGIVSRMSVNLRNGIVKCRREDKKAVVVQSTGFGGGCLVICSAEIGRVAPDTSSKDVRLLFEYMRKMMQESWHEATIREKKEAISFLDRESSRTKAQRSLVTLSKLQTREPFSFQEYMVILRTIDPEADEIEQTALMESLLEDGVLEEAGGRFKIIAKELEKEASSYGLGPFFRRLRNESSF